jgi:hypothetical protein
MTSTSPKLFEEQISSTYQELTTISEERSRVPYREGGWSRKEILGHLIDSALNNHQRFVRASLDGKYSGPTYLQEAWVRMHGYGSMEWSRLLEHWQLQNELLSEVVKRIPENRWEATCAVGENAPVTLRFLVDDYLVHLRHHIDQIVA